MLSLMSPKPSPSLLWMHFGFILTGMGTVLLGPILPLLAKQWALTDSHLGLLIASQMLGAFLGGITTSRNLRRALFVGCLCAFAGYLNLALSVARPSGMFNGCVSLAIAGYGLGQLITAINLVAGRRATTNRGSALSLLNFSWALGAVLWTFFIATVALRFPLSNVLTALSIAFTLLAIPRIIEFFRHTADEPAAPAPAATSTGLPIKIFVYFATLLIIYGGLETSLSAWLTTYSLRYGNHSLAISIYSTAIFWIALTSGRAIASAALLRIAEKTLLRLTLLVAVIATSALALSHSAIAIASCAAVIGLALAPWFPITFSLLVGHQPKPSQAGTVIAVSGLGAALLPWLMGITSTHSGSLQIALTLPLAAGIALLALSFLTPSPRTKIASV